MQKQQTPSDVLDAIFREDSRALSAMGRKGAEARRRKKQEKLLAEKEKALRLLEECEERAKEAHEDICPVDD